MEDHTQSSAPEPGAGGLHQAGAEHDDRGDHGHPETPIHTIHFEVDGEREKTTDKIQTPRHIIETYTSRDPLQYYLVQIRGHERISYQDQPDTPIELRDGMRFQTVSLGPTPVSDGTAPKVGPAYFLAGLREAGIEGTTLPGRPDHIVFDYVVQTGSKQGAQVKIGLVVPADFPATTPTGPHVSPRVFPIKTDGAHPHGAIHASHAQPFADALGGEWEYWSRPATDWQTRRKTVTAYLSHLWNLWDSQ